MSASVVLLLFLLLELQVFPVVDKCTFIAASVPDEKGYNLIDYLSFHYSVPLVVLPAPLFL